jgi:phosphonate transport system permease protein
VSRRTEALRQAGLPPRPPQYYKWTATTLLVVIAAWSAWDIDARWSRLWSAPRDLYEYTLLMLRNIDLSETWGLVQEMWESIAMAWLGTLLATIFALPLAFLAAENLVGKPLAWITRQVFNVLRAIPEIILVLIFIPVFGLTPLAGMVAIGVGSIGSLGKLFYELLEGIRAEPIEGVDAVGANGLERLRWGVVPQVAPELTSLVLYRFEVNIRASAVMGIVGAGGIGEAVSTAFQFNDYGTAGLGLIIMIVGTIIVDVVSGSIRKRIIAGPSQLVIADPVVAADLERPDMRAV